MMTRTVIIMMTLTIAQKHCKDDNYDEDDDDTYCKYGCFRSENDNFDDNDERNDTKDDDDIK